MSSNQHPFPPNVDPERFEEVIELCLGNSPTTRGELEQELPSNVNNVDGIVDFLSDINILSDGQQIELVDAGDVDDSSPAAILETGLRDWKHTRSDFNSVITNPNVEDKREFVKTLTENEDLNNQFGRVGWENIRSLGSLYQLTGLLDENSLEADDDADGDSLHTGDETASSGTAGESPDAPFQTPAIQLEDIRIRRYKNIRDAEFEIDDVIALLGKNESGKTSILEAIESLQDEDEYEDEQLCNDMKIESDTPIVTATTVAMMENVLSNKLSEVNIPEEFRYKVMKMPNGERKTVEVPDIVEEAVEQVADLAQSLTNSGFLSNSDEPYVLEETHRKKIQLLSDPIDPRKKVRTTQIDGIDNLIGEIKEWEESDEDRGEINLSQFHDYLLVYWFDRWLRQDEPVLPTIYYYNNYDQISNYSELGIESSVFNKMLDLGDFDPDSLTNGQARPHLKTVERKIEDRINESWSQKGVNIALGYGANAENKEKLELWIGDESVNGSNTDRHPTRPRERSDGFHWFFSFYIDFLTECSDTQRGSKLLLLDDPAVRLHPEGKRDWLKFVDSAAEEDQVVYTAHSPYLIDQNSLNRIRIVEDNDTDPDNDTESGNDGGTKISPIGEPEPESVGLKPLRDALGIKMNDTPFVSQCNIIVEGFTDVLILRGLARYIQTHPEEWDEDRDWIRASIVPAGGASKLPEMCKILKKENVSVIVIHDDDEEGRKHAERSHASDTLPIRSPDSENSDEKFEIEDMFPKTYYCKKMIKEINDKIKNKDISVDIEKKDGQVRISGECYNEKTTLETIKSFMRKELTEEELEEFTNEDEIEPPKVPVSRQIRNELASGEAGQDVLNMFKLISNDLNEAYREAVEESSILK